MKYTIQVSAYCYVQIQVFPLDVSDYEEAVEFVEKHGRPPYVQDFRRYVSSSFDGTFIDEDANVRLKVKNENDELISEFEIHDINHVPMTWAENEITHTKDFFFREYGEGKPCLIHRLYEGEMKDVELWEFELNSTNPPEVEDFTFKTVGLEVYNGIMPSGFIFGGFINALDEDNGLFYKGEPLELKYWPAHADGDAGSWPEAEFVLVDLNGKIIKEDLMFGVNDWNPVRWKD